MITDSLEKGVSKEGNVSEEKLKYIFNYAQMHVNHGHRLLAADALSPWSVFSQSGGPPRISVAHRDEEKNSNHDGVITVYESLHYEIADTLRQNFLENGLDYRIDERYKTP